MDNEYTLDYDSCALYFFNLFNTKKNFLEKSEKKEKGKEDRISFSTHRYLFFLSESIYDNNHLSFSSSPTFQI